MKLVPVRVTLVPTAPLVGVKLVIVGAATTVKLDELVPVPPEVVTLSFPVVTPVGATAVIEVELTTLKLLAAVPLNLTAVAPVKLVPVRVTVVPTAPLVGVKLVMVGAVAADRERPVTTIEMNRLARRELSLWFLRRTAIGLVTGLNRWPTSARQGPTNGHEQAQSMCNLVVITSVPWEECVYSWSLR